MPAMSDDWGVKGRSLVQGGGVFENDNLVRVKAGGVGCLVPTTS